MTDQEDHRYDDIIDLPHPVSANHPPMSRQSRAAQFCPFAALAGYGETIEEEKRLTDRFGELGDAELEELGRRIRLLLGQTRERPEIDVTYFLPDAKKAGGSYVTKSGRLKRIGETERLLYFTDGDTISLDAVKSIEGKVFETAEFD